MAAGIPDITPTAVEDAMRAVAAAQGAVNAKQKVVDFPPPGQSEADERTEKSELATANQILKQKTLALAAAKTTFCSDIGTIFRGGDVLSSWQWHKNKLPNMYFTQQFKYAGDKYVALAHLHGGFIGGFHGNDDQWVYDPHQPDKLEIYEVDRLILVCSKETMSGMIGRNGLHAQVDDAEIARHGTRGQFLGSGGPWPAKRDFDNMYYVYDDNYYSGDLSNKYTYQRNVVGLDIILISGIVVILCALCLITACIFGFLFGTFGWKFGIKQQDEHIVVHEQSI
eukprot:108879_1